MFAKLVSALTGGLIAALLGAVLFTISIPFEDYTVIPLDKIALLVFWLAALVFTLISADACASWKWQMRLSALLSFAIAAYAYRYPDIVRTITGTDSYYQADPAEIMAYASLFAGMVFLYLSMLFSSGRKNTLVKMTRCSTGLK